jgi:glucose-1-phosphate cytidylyltransferase
MKALILAGGKGTRFMEETDTKPKPMIEVNGTPIIFHIIDHYSTHGISEIYILAGYKKEYFINYFRNNKYKEKDGGFCFNTKTNVFVLDTGLDTATGGRIKLAKEYIDETFLLTYGDGLSNVNISKLIDFHKKNNLLATVTAVRPPARFGSLTIKENLVIDFGEKIQSKEGWINGGYFVLQKEVLDFIDGPDMPFEDSPLETLSRIEQLSAYEHTGFWYPIDTLREKVVLEKEIRNNNGKLPWKYD